MTVGGLAAVAREDWDARLRELGCADAYLRRAYVEASCALDPGEPFLLHLGGERGDVVLAGILRAAPEGALDVTTPYGYGGPVAVGAEPPLGRFWELYEAWCAERGVVTSFFRFHPLFENARHAGGNVAVELLGPTVSWPLAGGDDLLRGMHRTHRGKVRKAERAGAEVSVQVAPAELAGFGGLYEQTMARLDAGAYYRFPAEYWQALAAGLGDAVVLFEAVVAGEAVASALCLAGERWLHYHLSATSEAGRRSGAANLLLLRIAEWARARGLEALHLGGGLGGREDSLYAFKAHFSSSPRLEMHVGKAVHDVERYLRLSGAPALELAGFFPAYRGTPVGRQ